MAALYSNVLCAVVALGMVSTNMYFYTHVLQRQFVNYKIPNTQNDFTTVAQFCDYFNVRRNRNVLNRISLDSCVLCSCSMCTVGVRLAARLALLGQVVQPVPAAERPDVHLLREQSARRAAPATGVLCYLLNQVHHS